MMIFTNIMILTGGLLMILWNMKNYWLSSFILILVMLIYLMMNIFGVDMIYLSSSLSMDMISMSLIVLSLWIMVMMIYASTGVYLIKLNLSFFYLSLMGLLLVLLITFTVSNLVMFYFFFEFSLIPTLLIILGWGYQPERIQAGVYFLFYTLTASLPLLVGLFWLSDKAGSLMFFNLTKEMVFLGEDLLIFIMFFFAFLVKMPMFFVHLWLPKAHVEAPVSGSMILAGVLLKLGGYGFYRVIPFCVESFLSFGSYFFGLSILGMGYVGLLCCRLNDMKALVAYSSVAHMGLVICGVLSYYSWGFTGALAMMLAHGVSSSGLFCIVNMFYERSSSRSFYLNKGLIIYLPLFTFLFFMLCISNMAAPPTLNLVSEIMLMGSMMKFNYLMVLFFPLGSYLGAVFTLLLFSYSQHGRSYYSLSSLDYGLLREYHLFTLHILPVNFLILNLDFYLTN